MNAGEKKDLLGVLGGIVALAAVVGGLGIINSITEGMNAIPPGSNCSLVRMTHGTRDLDDSYTALQKAKSVKDEFGIAELERHDAAAELSEGTVCLVLDTDFFSHFSFYRKVRILSDVHVGKAFWVKKDDLKLGEPTRPPSEPVTCHDHNEYLGTSGVCWCKDGFTRDGTTQKCVPK
jgi:hypothetical protein